MRLTPEQVDSAVEVLISWGLIERAKREFNDGPGQPVALNPDAFCRKLLTLLVTQPEMNPYSKWPVGEREEPFNLWKEPPTLDELWELYALIWNLENLR